MFYQQVSIKGFGPYERKKTFSFNSGVSIISGVNGSGKSSIFDAIQWAIFGPSGSSRTLKDTTSVINLSSQSANVVLDISSEVHGDIRISRSLTQSKKHSLSLEVDGKKEKGGIRELQSRISEIFSGLGSESFTAIAMLLSSPSVAVNNFIIGTPTKRRSILADIADPTHEMEAKNKKAKENLRAKKSERDRLEGKASTVASLLDELVEVYPPEGKIEDLKSRRDELNLEINSLTVGDSLVHETMKRKKLEAHKESLKKQEEQALIELENCKEDVDSLREDLKDLNKKKKEVDYAFSQSQERRVSLEEEKKAADYIRDSLTERILHFTRVRDGLNRLHSASEAISHLVEDDPDTCPVCGTHGVSFDVDSLSHNEEITATEASIEKLTKQQSQVDSRIDYLVSELVSTQSISDSSRIVSDMREVKAEIDDARKKVQELNDLVYDDIPKEIDDIDNQIDLLGDVVQDSHEDKIRTLEAQRDAVVRAINDFSSQQQKYHDFCDSLESYQQKLDDANYDLNVVEKEVERLEKLKKDTSPTGIIAQDIASLMSTISGEATRIMSIIYGKDSVVELLSDTEDGSPTCIIVCDGRDLATFSHGEQAKIITSLMIGMVSAAHQHLGEWFPPLWDEPTVAMDADFSQQFFDSVSSVVEEAGEQIIIITRDDVELPSDCHEVVL